MYHNSYSQSDLVICIQLLGGQRGLFRNLLPDVNYWLLEVDNNGELVEGGQVYPVELVETNKETTIPFIQASIPPGANGIFLFVAQIEQSLYDPSNSPHYQITTGEGEIAVAYPWLSVHVISDCRVNSTATVNRRAKPDAYSASLGYLTEDEMGVVTGKWTDAYDYLWWMLSDLGWVRSDVVDEIGNCDLVPEVSP